MKCDRAIYSTLVLGFGSSTQPTNSSRARYRHQKEEKGKFPSPHRFNYFLAFGLSFAA